MPVKINCPHCRQDLRLPEDLYHRPSQCPLCQGAIAVRWPRVPAAVLADGERRPCPYCGQAILRQAVKCRFCQQWLEAK